MNISMHDAIEPNNAEFEAFEVDNNLVHQLIYSQNGTIPTSMRELLLNAFDAETNSVEMLIWATGFSIKDNGCGFASAEDIKKHFKRFGSKHESLAKHGRFRIGRGQIMAFAKTTWHSNTFKMTVDVKNAGTGYLFEDNAELYSGCHVYGSFYKSLNEHEIKNIVNELSLLVRYADVPVFINKIHVNRMRDEAWDHEDDDIKITYQPKGVSGVYLYSQGVLVKELQRYQYGLTAVIVTKKALQLNMARNDINEDDPLWVKIHRLLREQLKEHTDGKDKLSEEERLALINQFSTGELNFFQIWKSPILVDSRGKPTSFAMQIFKQRPWSSIYHDNQKRIAETISLRRQAFIMHQNEIANWGVEDLRQLLDMAITSAQKMKHVKGMPGVVDELMSVRVQPFDQLSDDVSIKHEILDLKVLTLRQQAQRKTLQYVADKMVGNLNNLGFDQVTKRRIFVGVSDTSNAWTDSASYIAINQNILGYFDNDIYGLTQLALILVHEFTHDEGSILTNEHGFEFYERFHDSVLSSMNTDVVGSAIRSLQTQYRNNLSNSGQPFPKWLGNDDDQVLIHIELTSKKPTPLLQWFLSMLKITPKQGIGWLDLSFTRVNFGEIKSLFIKQIEIESKSKNIPFDIKCSHLTSWEIRRKKQKAAYISLIKDVIAVSGINITDDDIKTIELWYDRPRYQCSQFGDLELLIGNPAFGIQSLERSRVQKTKAMAGNGFYYNIKLPDDVFDYDNRYMTAKSLSNLDSEERFAFFQKAIKSVVNSITDENAKNEFCDRIFNDDAKILFSNSMRDGHAEMDI